VVAGAVAALARKKSARMLDKAPFKFAPADGVGYFEKWRNTTKVNSARHPIP